MQAQLIAASEAGVAIDGCAVCGRQKCPDCKPNDWPPCDREPKNCHGGRPCEERRVDWHHLYVQSLHKRVQSAERINALQSTGEPLAPLAIGPSPKCLGCGSPTSLLGDFIQREWQCGGCGEYVLRILKVEPKATCGPDHHAPGGIISTGGAPFRCAVCDQVLGATQEEAHEAFNQPPTGGADV